MNVTVWSRASLATLQTVDEQLQPMSEAGKEAGDCLKFKMLVWKGNRISIGS